MMKRRPYTEAERQFDGAVGWRIEHIRKKRGVKQTELARAVGISQQSLGHYEAGRRCSAFLLAQMAHVLGVQVSMFVPSNTYCCNSEKTCAREQKIG